MTLSPMTVWLLVGIALCLSEVVIPTAFIACVMGISALVVAMVSPFLPLNLQVLLWMGLSALLVWVSRRFVRNRPERSMDAIEAETLTEILPGQVGRVLYEGNSWAAKCDDESVTIAPQERVYIVGRRGTTLMVMPQRLIHS